MKQNNIIIRKATKKDLVFFNKFSDQESTFTYEKLPEHFLCIPDLRLTDEEFGKILRSRKNFIFVADSDNKVVGVLYAVGKTDNEDYLSRNTKYAEIHTLWIDNLENSYKAEIANALLQEIEGWARTQNITEIRSLEFIQANANKKVYEQANFYTISVGLFKDLH